MDKTRQSANLVSENNIFSDITNNGVGIGTTTPTEKLQVIGNANISGILTATSFVGNLTGTATGLSGTPNINVGIATASSFVGNLTGTATGLNGTPNINVGILTATTASISGNVTVGGNVSIAGTLTYEDVTNVDSIGLVTARSGVKLTGGDVTLGTGVTISGATSNVFTLSTNGSERVRVSSAGSFGVGISAPQYLSHINATKNTTSLFITTNSVSTAQDYSQIGFGNNPSGNEIFAAIRHSYDNPGAGAAGALRFYTHTGSVLNERVVIDSSGRLGIGTASPEATLDVFGVPNVNYGNATLFDSTSTAANVGGVLTLGGYKTAQTSKSLFGFIKGGKENATSGNESGYLAFGTNNNTSNSEKARLSSTGGFSVGTTANPGAGAIYATGDITAFYSSDIRLKKDIEPISEPIKKLMEISGVTYKWNEEYLKDKDVDGYFVRETEVGVIAQEVEKVLPEVVATRENGYKAVRYEKLVALLIEAVKDQQHQIDELKARLEEV